MKSTISARALMLLSALFFSIVMCHGQDDPSDPLVGKWTKLVNERSITFTLMSDHKYQVEFAGDDEIDVYGSYVVSGTQITFTDEDGDYAADVPGVYKFQVSGTSLTLTATDDPIDGRSMLVEGTWSKAGD
jgi:hypothetical protein